MQAQIDTDKFVSLLPYLAGNSQDSSTGLSLAAGDRSAIGNFFPFRVLNDSIPTARLLEAEFVTDTGSGLKKVFLLLQKDRYFFQGDELRPLANPDIDRLWQQAFSFHHLKGNDASDGVVLAAQLRENGELNPLASLFFCRTRQQFFHPPCPLCGLPLRLCLDDDLLAVAGLQPYSTSLKRYLYCASCTAGGGGAFYINERDAADPLVLKDREALIREFGSLRQSRDPVCPFPCIGCPEHGACFGPDGAAGSRIVPFSFYPFHLLIFDALSLNALDFLPLISGASFEEVASRLVSRNESGRSHCLTGLKAGEFAGATFFAPSDERYFPEVLFLKLAFLGDILRQFLAGPDLLGNPDMRPTIDRVWVEFPNRSGLLPAFWNFRTKVIDLGGFPDATGLPPKKTSSDLLFYLGMLWFYALLVNKKQGSKEVLSAVKDGLSGNEDFPEFSVGPFPVLFAAENIFWDPDGGNVGGDWQSLWRKTLDLGLGMLRSATGHDRQWSIGVFFEEFERLRTEVKIALFTESPPGGEVTVQNGWQAGKAGIDEEIGGILSGILDRWRGSLKNETPPTPGEEDPRLLETVIFAPLRDIPVTAPAGPEEYTETVVLSTNHRHSEPTAGRQQNVTDDSLTETVIIAPERPPEDLEATVILTAGADRVDPKSLPETAGEDDPEATVILPPRKTMAWDKGRSG
jgi:hypothetical protein